MSLTEIEVQQAKDQVQAILDNIPLLYACQVAQWAADRYAIHLPIFVRGDEHE